MPKTKTKAGPKMMAKMRCSRRILSRCGFQETKKPPLLGGGWLLRRAVPANVSSYYEKTQAEINYTMRIISGMKFLVKQFAQNF